MNGGRIGSILLILKSSKSRFRQDAAMILDDIV